MTNSQKIRAVTDEEMAEYFMMGCPPNADCWAITCYNCWLDYLKQEAEQ